MQTQSHDEPVWGTPERGVMCKILGPSAIAEPTLSLSEEYVRRVIDSGRGAARAEDAQEMPTQSHISPSIQVYEDIANFRRSPSVQSVSVVYIRVMSSYTYVCKRPSQRHSGCRCFETRST